MDEAVHPDVELSPCPRVVVVGQCEFVAACGRRFPCQYRHGSVPLFDFVRGPILQSLTCTAPTLRPNLQDSQKGLAAELRYGHRLTGSGPTES